MIACILIPRLALRAACRSGSLDDAAALAPAPEEGQAIGEVSRGAEAQGVRAGMRLNEALAHCPGLRLVPPDPARASEIWDQVLRDLEGIGAGVESKRPGEAFFTVEGLCGLYGGDVAGVASAARAAVQVPVRVAFAPTRFAAYAAAKRVPRLPRRLLGPCAEAVIPPGALRSFLSKLPVSILAPRLETGERQAEDFVGALNRAGIQTLGALATLSASQVADRFGSLGLHALRLARGEDSPPVPRAIHEDVVARIELPEGTAGPQLGRALELLVDRLLATPERRGRSVLALRLTAQLCGGGSWSVEQGLGRATTSQATLCSLLSPKLADLPGPAASLSLQVIGLGAAAPEQPVLSEVGRPPSRSRLAKSIRELRAMQGAEALLKVIDVDSGSRIPERRVVLTPYPSP